jgi:response regulator RpfG family c-di-GMP phosphodiesterase
MKQHAIKGAQMLLKSSQSEYEDMAVQIALNHHECWNGTGYPGHVNPLTEQPLSGHVAKEGTAQPKKGDEIPIVGRVVAVADVYDALSCDRAHRTALPEEKALSILREESGERFDPEIVDAFFSGIDTIRAIAQQFSE